MIFETVLLEQQALVTLLLQRAQQPATDDEQRRTIEQLTAALAGHLGALDQVVIPSLEPAAEPAAFEPMVQLAGVLSRTLAQLIVTDPASPAAAGLRAAVAEGTLQLFELERKRLLPVVQGLESAQVELQLASALEIQFQRAVGDDAARAFATTLSGDL